MQKKLISLVVTCFNERENIEEMYHRVVAVFKKLPAYEFELLYVDNDSIDTTQKIIATVSRKDKRVKAIFMSRNFGSPQPSFLAGLEYATGKAAVLLHGDIQDPPELIPALIEKWEEGYNVVYGVRSKRQGYNFLWNFFYKAFYFLLNKLAYIQIPLDAGDFSLIDRRVIYELLQIEEYDYYVRCLRAFVGFKQVGVPYVREARHHGRSNESFLTSLWWAKTIVVNFSFKPLEWISMLAFIVTAFGFLLMIIDIVLVLTFRNAPRGIPTIVILMLFLGGVQLLSLSVIAEYLAKIFLEVKRRPRYIVCQTLNITHKKGTYEKKIRTS